MIFATPLASFGAGERRLRAGREDEVGGVVVRVLRAVGLADEEVVAGAPFGVGNGRPGASVGGSRKASPAPSNCMLPTASITSPAALRIWMPPVSLIPVP